MAARKGRLIAIEGSGAALHAAARSVARSLREGTGSGYVSAWDASGIFTELAAGDADLAAASVRTVTLLYAADLAFRIRWHIAPALEAGESVVAAPYVESAKALAIGAGLSRRWVDELFAFAPRPFRCYRITGAARPTSGGGRSYLDWFLTVVAANGSGIEPKTLRTRSAQYMRSLESRGRCRPLTSAETDRLKRPARRA